MPADPTRAVAEAAGRTLEAGVRHLELRVESPAAEYSAAGLFEPSEGRFRVEARFRQAPALRDPTRLVAVGIDRRTTFEEHFARFEGERQRCWLQTHLPVGSYGGATSLEESVRLVAVALEALGERRVASASARGSDGPGIAAYAVTLKPLPPKDRQTAPGFRSTETAARLLGKLDGPVRLAVDEDGRIVELRLKLSGYRPQSRLRRHEPERVAIKARLSEAEGELRLDRPECMGME